VGRGILLVLSGPSGVGKSSILKRLLPQDGLVMSISCTTRPPRPGEKDGGEYFFLSTQEFMRRVAAGEMAEYAEVFGNLYGTPKDFLERNLAAGRDVITDIDVQGAEKIKQAFPQAVMLFVAPPGRAELEKRLRTRSTENEPDLLRRLKTADEEMSRLHMYDYIVVNDDLDRAAAVVSAVRTAERAKREKMMEELSW